MKDESLKRAHSHDKNCPNPRSVVTKVNGRSLKSSQDSVRINVILRGEPAKWLRDLRNRGIINSWHQGIIRALETLHREWVDQEIRTAQLKNLSRASENGSPE